MCYLGLGYHNCNKIVSLQEYYFVRRFFDVFKFLVGNAIDSTDTIEILAKADIFHAVWLLAVLFENP